MFSHGENDLKFLVWTVCSDLIAPDKFQVKTYFSEGQPLFNCVIIVKLDSNFTFVAALEKTEMPKLVNVHKMSQPPNTHMVHNLLGGSKQSMPSSRWL